MKSVVLVLSLWIITLILHLLSHVEHHGNTGSVLVKQSTLDKKRQRQRNKARFLYALKDEPCVDCGIKYPHYVMQFDHVPERGEKIMDVSAMKYYSLDRILAEIEKCDLVCANCHCERTHRRSLAQSVEQSVEAR